MLVVLILALFGRLSEGVLLPHVNPIPMVHQTIPIAHSPIGMGIRPPLTSLGTGGLVTSIFDSLLGGSQLPVDLHHRHIDEPIGGHIHGDSQGLSHGHVGDNCQHKKFGCDVPGYHCVQTSERGYSPCTDGQSAHCHCKRGCVHKGFFIQHGYRRKFFAECRICQCIYGQMTCRRMRGRRCRRFRFRDHIDHI